MSSHQGAQSVPHMIPDRKRVEKAAETIAGYVGFREWASMAEDRSDLRSKIRYGYDVNEPTKWDCREAASAVLFADGASSPSPSISGE